MGCRDPGIFSTSPNPGILKNLIPGFFQDSQKPLNDCILRKSRDWKFLIPLGPDYGSLTFEPDLEGEFIIVKLSYLEFIEPIYFNDTGEDGIDEKPVVEDDDDDDDDDKGGDETESGLDLHSSSYSFGTVYEVSGMIGERLELLRWR